MQGALDLAHQPRILLFVALALIIVIAPLVSALLARRTVSVTPRGKHARYARTMLIVWAISALALYALRLHGQGLADVGFVQPRKPALEAYLIALILPIYTLIFSRMRNRPVNAEYLERLRRIAPTSPADWLWFVPVALTAGLCEEFLYRGYAITVLAAMMGSVPSAVLISCVAFGLAHAYQGWRGVVGTTVFGLYFALIFVGFGSLWPCIIGHILQDLIGGVLVARRLAAEPPPPEAGSSTPSAAEGQPS